MCIRYSKEDGELIRWSKQVNAWILLSDWTEGKDTFPGYTAPILTPDWERGRVFQRATWGMQPSWASKANYGKTNAILARSESIAEKPTFRTAYRKRRCVVPASTFYEQQDGRWVGFRAETGMFAMAGIYEPPNQWTELPTYSVVTCVPNQTVQPYQDRMPVLLALDDIDIWMDLNTNEADLRALMVPAPDRWIRKEDGGPIVQARKKTSDGQSSLFEDS